MQPNRLLLQLLAASTAWDGVAAIEIESGSLIVAEFLVTFDQHLDDDLHLHGKLGGNLPPLSAVDLQYGAHGKIL
jgi:cytoskeletal protein CcmA (bactofilin family)